MLTSHISMLYMIGKWTLDYNDTYI